MNELFRSIYWKIKNNRWPALGLLLVLLLGMAWAASRLQLEEDITRLLPTTSENEIVYKVLQHANFSDKIIVHLSANEKGTADDLTAYAGQLIDSLQQCCASFIKDIQGRIADDAALQTLDFVYDHLPLFMQEADYQTITKRLHPDSINHQTQTNYKTLLSPTGLVARKTILRDPLGLTFLGLQKWQQLNITEGFSLYNQYLLSDNRRHLLLFINPQLAANETNQNAQFVDELYQISDQLNSAFTDRVTGSYFGTTVVAVANARQIKKDIQTTVGIAVCVLLVILFFFYKKLAVPLLLFVPTLLGGLLGIALLSALKGTTSAISLGIGSVLLGITLDYSLHILTHFRNSGNVERVLNDVARPVLMSSLTTACAFLCLLFVSSEALQDLGLFAAISVLGAAIAALIFIPQVYRVDPKNRQPGSTLIDRVAAIDFGQQKWLLIGLVILLASAWWSYDKVFFNQSLSGMNYQTEALHQTERQLDALIDNQAKSVYLITYGDNSEQALTAHNRLSPRLEQLRQQGLLIRHSSIGGVVLSQKEQAEKIKRWETFWNEERRSFLVDQLIESGNQLGFKPSSFQAFYNLLEKPFQPITPADYDTLSSVPLQDFLSEKDGFATVSSLLKLPHEKKAAVKNAFAGFPQTLVIDRQGVNEAFLGNLKNDFNRLMTCSAVVVFLLLLLYFRRIELALITITPILLTWWLAVGLMGWLGLEFNVFNIIISTFIFGLGVDYSIFMTSGLIKNYKYGTNELPTYQAAIILSVITTILGVGVLVFAKHPALRSIAVVSLLGIVSAMLMSFVVQPFLFRQIISGRAARGFAPLRLRQTLHGFLLFAYYGLGGVVLSLFSVTILPLIPISKKVKMGWLHRFMGRMVTSVLRGNSFVTKEIRNPHNETFDPPAIVISNHSSALDTLVMGMVTHRLIYLVNDWVYKSPVFGLLARVAGFYPVSSGVDNSLDHLREKLRQGYSLVVFPEGKRSRTNKMGRFHKGAFFLAEQLKIDILPMYLHGNSEVLPKGDRVIYDGAITVLIGRRIAHDDPAFGSSDKERQKKIGAFYKQRFHQLRSEIEQADYFKGILLSNYIYKGDAFYQQIRRDFETRKQLYQTISEFLLFKANILHLADDYGQMDVLLVARSPDRKITTVIADEEKRRVAVNCYTAKHRRVTYVDNIRPFNDVLEEANDMVAPLPAALLIRTSPEHLPEALVGRLGEFDQVVLMKNQHLEKQLADQGFIKRDEKERVTLWLRP